MKIITFVALGMRDSNNQDLKHGFVHNKTTPMGDLQTPAFDDLGTYADMSIVVNNWFS